MANSVSTLTAIRKEIKQLADPKIAEHSQRFFKTGPGQYGEGDKFVGIRVPVLRKLAKQHRSLPLNKTVTLLQSPIHEERLLALLILVLRFQKGGEDEKKRVFDLYCKNFRYVNNWDLVDCSAHKIVGEYLLERSRTLLHRLAKSKILWERRIAIIATLAFIYQHDFEDTLDIATQLLNDEEDLIQKAVGWMLREVGNREIGLEEAFLKEHYKSMPRTMLRYAIEKFPERKRKKYLKGEI